MLSGMEGQAVQLNDKRDGRRTDTRARIHDVALDVFCERGYERATLREIADNLGITRPALYYHYRSKDDILTCIHRELAGYVDEVIDWAKSRPPQLSTRQAMLDRLAELLSGPWGKFMRFAQENEAALRNVSSACEFNDRMDAIADLLSPSGTVRGRLNGRLALSALFMANGRGDKLGGTHRQRMSGALATARELVR